MNAVPYRVILSRADGEGPVTSGAASVRYGSFAVCAAQDDTWFEEPRA
jgi:hypothetical protein